MIAEQHAIRAQFPILARKIRGQSLHYLDNAATTFSPQVVIDAIVEFECSYRANVHRGLHSLATEVTEAYCNARLRAARFLNAAGPEEIVFTSGTTHAMNMLANALGQTLGRSDEVLVSLTEHHSAFLPWQQICQRTGAALRTIPVDAAGCLDFSDLDELITERTRIIVLTHASNVTGEITDFSDIASLARSQNALLIVDGAQMAAQGPVDIGKLGADFYAFSGHKCYGPTGVGVLWGRGDSLARLTPFAVGGGMVESVTLERAQFLHSHLKLEAGTPPIGQAIGLGLALEWLMEQDLETKARRDKHLIDTVIGRLRERPGVQILGPAPGQNRLPLCSFAISHCHPHDISQLLDERGVAVRAGHHCAQPLMKQLGLSATTRASLAIFNDQTDADALLDGLDYAIGELS